MHINALANLLLGALAAVLGVFLFSAVTQIVGGPQLAYVPETIAGIVGVSGARMAQTAYTETRYASSYASIGQTPPAPSVGLPGTISFEPPP